MFYWKGTLKNGVPERSGDGFPLMLRPVSEWKQNMKVLMNAGIGMRIILMMLTVGMTMTAGADEGWELMDAEGERFFGQGSFERAAARYSSLQSPQQTEIEALWTKFRTTDAGWRAKASTNQGDRRWMEEADASLESLIRVETGDDRQSFVRAHILESQGDLGVIKSGPWDSEAWAPHYQRALDYWAGTEPSERTREKYLDIARRLLSPGSMGAGRLPEAGNVQSSEMSRVAENGLQIAVTDEDVSFMARSLVQWLRRQGRPGETDRAHRYLSRALERVAPGIHRWRLLNEKADLLTSPGIPSRDGDGNWIYQSDFTAAIDALEQIIQGDRNNQSGLVENARRRIEDIRKAEMRIIVPGFFRPGQQIEVGTWFRNLENISLTIRAVSENSRLRPGDDLIRRSNAGDIFTSLTSVPVHQQMIRNEGYQDHRPVSRTVTLDSGLDAGLYVVEVRSGQETSRELLVVTGAMAVNQNHGQGVSLFFADAESGAPLANTTVRILRGLRGRNNSWSYREYQFRAGQDGIIKLTPSNVDRLAESQLLVLARTPAGPVIYTDSGSIPYSQLGGEGLKFYSYADRPAYRPGDEIHWKVIVRRPDGGGYRVFSGTPVEYRIVSPRGESVEEGTLMLNDFGTAVSSLTLGEDQPLGAYRVQFKTSGDRYWVANDELFRMEEYKLPDFFVEVDVPVDEESGEAKVFKPGDRVEAEVRAEYYFGAPVQNAEVDVVVRRASWDYRWPEPVDYPWYRSGPSGGFAGRIAVPDRFPGGGEEVYRETLRTDVSGRVIVSFDTGDLEIGSDHEFTIEARVTDSSRVQVLGTGTVKVTEKPYFVSASMDHVIHKPGDPIRVAWKFRDANGNPVKVTGRVQVALQNVIERPDPPLRPQPRPMRQGRMIYPGPPRPDTDIYQYEVLTTLDVISGDDGEAETTWRPEKPGVYRLLWVDEKLPAYLDPETSVLAWVLAGDQETVGYRSGGIEIVLDRKSAESGEAFTFVLAPSRPDSHVWLGYEIGNSWIEEVVHITGNARVMRFDVDSDVARNFFVHAVLVRDHSHFRDMKEILVPPSSKMLTMELKPSSLEYLPGGASSWELTVTDRDGKPVQGELSLAVFDKAIEAIASDPSQPIQSFFYGDKYYSAVRYGSMNAFGVFVSDDPDGEGSLAMGGAGSGRMLSETRAKNQLYFESGGVAPEAVAMRSMAVAADGVMPAAPRDQGAVDLPAVPVRTDFRKTAYWNGRITTDADGRAMVDFALPDSLTTWVALGKFIDGKTAVAQSQTEVITSTPLSVRTELPRFMIAGDEAVLTALVLNQTEESRSVELAWDLEGSGVVLDSSSRQSKVLGPGEEGVFELRTRANAEGTIDVTATVRSRGFQDSTGDSFPVYQHGMEKFVFRSGKQSSGNVLEELTLPARRAPGSTHLTIRVTPSLAVSMLDALPYMIQYPYGCVEQTMSRFMPAVVVSRTLTDLGLDGSDVADRIFGGMDETFRESGKIRPGEGMDRLDDVINSSLKRIYDFQKPSGGWGWWKEGPEDLFMTAYVVWGLAMSHDAGRGVDIAALERGSNFLISRLGTLHENPDLLIWVLRCLAVCHEKVFAGSVLSPLQTEAFDKAWDGHTRLNAYTRSLLAVVAAVHGEMDKAKLLVRNLENGVIAVDGLSAVNPGAGQRGPSMVHWGRDGLFFRWSESAVESTAMAVEAMSRIDPENPLLEPAVNWLLANRRAASWNNTRDTAMTVLALNQYLRQSGELMHPLDLTVSFNNREIAGLSFDRASILDAPAAVTVPAEMLQDETQFRILLSRKESRAPVYYSIEAEYFSLEKPIQPSGNTLFVRRAVEKLEPFQTLLKGFQNRGIALGDRPVAVSGDALRVSLMVEARMDLEYVVIEDFKPACMEFTTLQSGGGLSLRQMRQDRRGNWVPAGSSIRAYAEWRDNRGAFFIDRLPEGVWQLQYDARTQVPGSFHALPAVGSAMYVPEIIGNSLENIWSVRDRE